MWYDFLIARFRDHLQNFHADIDIHEEVDFMMQHLHYENWSPSEDSISCCQHGCKWELKFRLKFNLEVVE
tara:strand:+ start:631 stop:840 length:210 start_codon:yes stop_codon:yes gene_type:complete